MLDIEAITERILLIGNGRILLDGSMHELQKRFSGERILIVDYNGKAPELSSEMNLVELKEGRISVAFDPGVLPVSDAIAYISKQTEIIDLSVSGISAEQMVAALYEEYSI